MIRYEAEEDGGTLAAYSGTDTFFDRDSPTGDMYQWRARVVLDDGGGGETIQPWGPWVEQDCPPAQPTSVEVVCASSQVIIGYGGSNWFSWPIYGDAWGLEGTWDDDTRAVTYESQIEEDPLPAEKAVAGTRLDDVLAPDEYGTTFGGRARIRALGDNDTASEWSDWADYQCLPTGFTAECLAPAHSAVTVWWDAYAGGGTLLRYEAEEDGGDLAAFSGTATSFARRSPTGDAYRWRARMVFDDGNGGETEGPWTPWADLECPPAQPTGLVLACADKTITLWGSYFGAVFPIGSAAGWEVSGTWNADTRAVTYEHQRLTDPLAAPAALTGTVLGTARTSTDFSAGSYRIRALGNNNIVSEWSEWRDYECLPIPTGLTVDCSSGTTVAVSWDPNPSATGYEAEEDGSSLPAYSGAAASFTPHRDDRRHLPLAGPRHHRRHRNPMVRLGRGDLRAAARQPEGRMHLRRHGPRDPVRIMGPGRLGVRLRSRRGRRRHGHLRRHGGVVHPPAPAGRRQHRIPVAGPGHRHRQPRISLVRLDVRHLARPPRRL